MNYKKIYDGLNKSEIFNPGDESIWTNEHMATSMLTAHLDDSNDAASYNALKRKQICDFIIDKTDVTMGDKIVDFGCGPGLYCNAFALDGYDVTGIDQSDNSLGYGRDRAEADGINIDYINEDYTKISGLYDYSLAIMISCDYGVLPPSQRKLFLKNVNDSLASGGYFVLDVMNENEYNNQKQNSENTWSQEESGFYRPHPYTVMSRKHFYDDEKVICDTHCVLDGASTIYKVYQTYFTKNRITAELDESGFEVVGVYGNLLGDELTSKSSKMGIVCRKID